MCIRFFVLGADRIQIFVFVRGVSSTADSLLDFYFAALVCALEVL